MTMKECDHRVGDRIRARRHHLDKTVREIAELAGISHTTLSRIERGVMAATNRFMLADIARALSCHVDTLTGVVVPAGADRAAVAAGVYDTIHALLDADLDFTPEPATDLAPLVALGERVDDAVQLRQRCDYATLVGRLPRLVHDLYDATTGPHRAEALTMLVRVAEAASFAVRYTGDPRSAAIAADRARQAALAHGSPTLLGFSEWARAHAALGCGLHDRAAKIAGKAADELTAAGDSPARLEMLGMLNLTLAFSLAGAGRITAAMDPLREARELAERTGETDTLGLMFGPTNVQLWALAIHTDAGDPNDAVPLITAINPALVPSPSRQVCFYGDSARLLAKVGEYDRAVKFFEIAERIAPQRIYGDPIAQEAVAGLLETVRQRAVSTRLRGLASRVGVPT